MSDIRKLEGVHPQLERAVVRLLYVMSELGHPMCVTDGVRTTAQQQRLYALGRTIPGKKVTNADGIKAKSNHQVKDDGFGHAVDMTFLVNGVPAWPDNAPWELYGEVAKALGLKWGGDWRTPDRPHIELP